MDSDEEMMPPMGDDYDDEDEGMAEVELPSDAANLPEGVKKEVITEVQGWKTPKKGDEVTVHYVGTLLSDGSKFDSSRDRGQPFVFTLGQGQVIKGWDVGVATMKRGEVAKFTLAPEFAYGASGSPPKIPENATLVFEVELISWMSKDDLFGDEGVIKQQLKAGSGYKMPRPDGEVKLTVQTTSTDGATIEEFQSVEYQVGSQKFGNLGKAIDKVLIQMKRGEKVALTCSKDYAYGDKHPDGATINITLEEIYESKDISFEKDGSLMKKQIKEGAGFETAKDGAKATVVVSKATDGSGNDLPGFAPKTLEFPVGSGEVCDGLECAMAEMKRGEVAILTAKASLLLDPKLGLQDAKCETIVAVVELQDFETLKETWDMSEDEKLEYGTARKEVGSQLLKNGRLQLALQRYKKVTDLFSYVDNYSEDKKEKAKALKLACEANKAAVYLKLKNWDEVMKSCNAVLKEDKNHVKCIYRRAQAQLNLKNFADCMSDCKTVIDLDRTNKEALALLKQAQAGQKQEDKKAKGLFQNMCKALGKGPIPEPGKAAPVGDFSSDEDMPDAAPAEEEKKSEEA
mmetsp:Transcript_9990/g.21978  ORF Transcript_9990/g.21978 Transcript_9990/m.21978 type:complete len:572 (-) Transcript_9990:468-2183(-)